MNFIENVFCNISSDFIIGPEYLDLPLNQKHEPIISPTQYILLFAILFLLVKWFGPTKPNDTIDQQKTIQFVLKLLNKKIKILLEFCLIFLCFISAVLLSVFLIPISFGCLMYRQYVLQKIKNKYKNHFKGLLDGTDALWAAEDINSKSIINVVALLKMKSDSNAKDVSAEVLLAFRKRLSSRLLGDYMPFPKMFYKRVKEFGYCFWTDQSSCTIEDYIRYVPRSTNMESVNCSMETIEKTFSELCNKSLLDNHSASWEILISRQHIINNSNEILIPVFFRIHHSLGDGIALLRLFLETVADKQNNLKSDYWMYCSKQRKSITSLLPAASTNNYLINKFHILNKMKLFFKKLYFNFPNYMYNLRMKTCIIIKAPYSLVLQIFCKLPDKNALHPLNLSGEKLIAWYVEENPNENLIYKIKSLRQHFHVKFMDIVLTALSLSLENYFSRKQFSVPEQLTVVLPVRMEIEPITLKLQNRFSVGMQTLPIKTSYSSTQSSAEYQRKYLEHFTTQLNKVAYHSNVLRNSSDFWVNYWAISILPKLLPLNALGPLAHSPISTLVFSNLPGPQNHTTINGFDIKNLIFWLPNRGNTGIGVTLLSYNSKLQLGIMADNFAINKSEDLYNILHDTVNNIHSIYNSLKNQSKRDN